VINRHNGRSRWAAILAVGSGLGIFPGTGGFADAAAQPARDRPAAEAFVDSIAPLTDRESIRVLERDLLVRVKRDRLNPTLHFRLGHLALKQDEPNDAAAEFKWATQLEPRWAAAWFGSARAELALGALADTTSIGRRALLARDAWNRAAAALALAAEALIADPSAPTAAVVRAGLRRGAAGEGTARGSAVAVLALGRVERLLGDSGAAIAAFDRAAGLPGGRGLGLLEAARTRLLRGDRQGIENYFEAAAVDDSESVASLRAEVGWIATAEELARFESLKGAARSAMLRTFWISRDRADLRQDGDRLREHARRLSVARRLFANPDDQRVAVLIRHGEPDNRAAARPVAARPTTDVLRLNESWRYRWPEGDLIVHFVAGADTTNYRVVESVFDVIPGDTQAAGDERPSGSADLVDLLLRSRAQLSPFYQAAAVGRRDQLATFRAREREIGRASRNLALTTDRFPLRFDRDLAARIRILSGGVGGAGQLDLAFAIPGFVFDSTRDAGPARYQTRVRIAIWDSAQSAFALDTLLITELAQPVTREGAVHGVVSTPLPPGWYSVRAALEAESRGSVASRDRVAIGGWTGGTGSARAPGEAVLSDLAIGLPGRGVTLSSGRPLDPVGVFRRSDTVTASLAYFAAAPGPVRVRYQLRPISGTGDEEKWRGFPGRSGWTLVDMAAEATIETTLPLRGLKPGPYEVEAVVVDGAGSELRQRARLEVAAFP
jgi:GWxTD domain-containing protein